MISLINEIVNRNLSDLKIDSNIISIFVVGSMTSDDYNIKEVNDYDLRFVVRDYNNETMSKINQALENIKKELEMINLGCEISNVIGPVKMMAKRDKNILLHAITLTEENLNSLPNIHKYSYSCKYKQLYGKDLLYDFQGIVITADDVIKSVEGIDYCMDLIKRGKTSYNELTTKNGKYILRHNENDASIYDQIELFKYSYKKTKDNILNMIRTNNISQEKINNYISYNEKEKLLIKKIEENTLKGDDISKNYNTIISILLKLKKSCLQLYARKKYYNSLDWGIINKESKGIRSKGFDFLKKINLPIGNNFSIKFSDLYSDREKIDKKLNNSKYLVLLEPPNNKFKRFGINDVNSFESIAEFIDQINNDFSLYTVSFVEKILELDDSFSGTVISDGKGRTVIEIIKNTCDSRELTSIGVDRRKTQIYQFISFDDTSQQVPSRIREIKDVCQYFRGYYEFAYGCIRGINDVYFTFYSNNNAYLNIFEGVKKYGKTLRNR